MRKEKLEVNEQPSYTGTYELKDTAEMMASSDYKVRFIAEYIQASIRLRKLEAILNKVEAATVAGYADPTIFLGFTPSCPTTLLSDQCKAMRHYVHVLKIRAIIEDIDLSVIEIRL